MVKFAKANVFYHFAFEGEQETYFEVKERFHGARSKFNTKMVAKNICSWVVCGVWGPAFKGVIVAIQCWGNGQPEETTLP